jgi:hypothetical protein
MGFLAAFYGQTHHCINAGEFELATRVDDIKHHDEELQCETAKTAQTITIRDMNPLMSCYYYSKAVCRMTQWAFIVEFAVDNHSVCGLVSILPSHNSQKMGYKPMEQSWSTHPPS